MLKRVDVLDYGYVGLIESWGSDERVIEAARMSVGRGFLRWDAGSCPVCGGDGYSKESSLGDDPCQGCDGKGTVIGDERLLRTLHTKQHTTPFEMAGAVVEVKAPIMVFREWHRHRTQSYNEASARYSPLPNENYLPTLDRLMRGSDGRNKQAGTMKGSDVLTPESALEWQAQLADYYDLGERLYQDGLAWGVPKELARLCLTVGRYSKMRASANLLNWLKFLKLRLPDDAQEEIRLYAGEVRKVLVELFPRTMALFLESGG